MNKKSKTAKHATPEAQRAELRLFVEIDGYDENPLYCGSASEVRRVSASIACYVAEAVENLICDQRREVVVRITGKRMTDDEVSALPEG